MSKSKALLAAEELVTAISRDWDGSDTLDLADIIEAFIYNCGCFEDVPVSGLICFGTEHFMDCAKAAKAHKLH